MTGPDIDQPSTHEIRSGRLAASIAAAGAELHSIRTKAGCELLWQAGPEWKRHAPVLFPIVGRLAHDTLLYDGRRFTMTQHGFARDRPFRFITREADACRLLLEDDAESRRIYPFAFRIEIEYRIDGDVLSVTYSLSNPAGETLPASLGAHPAFNWPLDAASPASAYEIVFERPETAPIRRVEGGLLRPASAPTPNRGRHLALDPSLFNDDAVILEAPASTSLRFGVPGGPGLRIGWSGFSQLGLWSKPGAAFLCVEPWSGLASPQGFDGPFTTKPYLLHIPPGGSFQARWTLEPDGIA